MRFDGSKEDIEDVIVEYMNSSGDNTMIEDALSNMPYSRESVDELMDVCESYDVIEIYTKLLSDFVDLLTEEELKKVIDDYNKKFDIPLSVWGIG